LSQPLFRLFLSGTSLLLLSAATAATMTDQGDPALLLGASFERPPVFRFLPGSKHTIIYPALLDKEGWITPVKKNLSPGEWDHFLREARERSSYLLATVDPAMIRDSRGIIQMAVITADSPLVASCILLPGFLERFSAVFGPELLIVIPARNKIYVFPKLANRIQDTLQTIHDDKLISPMPISMELFELSKHGLRTVGNLESYDD